MPRDWSSDVCSSDLIGREEIFRPPGLVPGDRHRDIALDLAHPVDELVAVRIEVLAQRINDHRRMPRTNPRDAGAGEKRLPPRRAAPQIVAAKAERPLA